jgi:ATP-dependent Clp protease ATP-binding subunit ClpA
MSQTEEPKKIDIDSNDMQPTDSDKKDPSSDDRETSHDDDDLPSLSSIEILDFKKTPERHKELHRFEQILNAPIHNIPLLFLEKHEDALPLLSLYAKKNKIGFLSISPSVFGMDFDDSELPYKIEEKLDKVGKILEFTDLEKEIPVYCDLLDYMGHNIWGKFSQNCLQLDRPFVIIAKKEEQQDIKEEINTGFNISGPLENPEAPYIPKGLAKTTELQIAPLTNDEKKVYLTHYFNRLLFDNELLCSNKEKRYLIQESIKCTSGEKALFEIFRAFDHLITVTKQSKQKIISRELVKKTLTEKLPVYNQVERLMDMDDRLKEQIFGQDDAINKCYETILATIDDEKREKPSVLAFFGPSGVGKTALAEEISLVMTGKNVVKINMSEYSESFKSSILIGSAKGYVDSDEDGLLAKTIKENPKAVILLDEFEKAHPKVQQLFLGIFDKGSVFDNHAGQIDMSKTTIILTSNAGVRLEQTLGFGASTTPDYVADEKIIKESFAPELLGRLDAKILFNPLTDEALLKIIDKYMLQMKPRFDKLGVQVILSPEVKTNLLKHGKDPMFGARPILSLMRQKVKLPVEIGVLKKRIKKGNQVIINSLEKDDLIIHPKKLGQVQTGLSKTNQR